MKRLRRVGDAASPWLPGAIVVALAFALLNALFLGDAEAQTVAAAAPTAAPSPTAGLFQGLVGLVVVVALILAAGWLLKKIGPRGRATGVVHVVGGASVGPREKVVVVRFGDRTLLLGVAPGQVSLLHAVDATEGPDVAATDVAARPLRFADRLRAARGGA